MMAQTSDRLIAAGAHDHLSPSAGPVRAILDTALLAEHISKTFYYTGLTTPEVMGDTRLAGASHDPHNPGLPPGGNPSHVRYLQAALDAEIQHAAIWAAAGARSPVGRVYFPAHAFQRLGTAAVAESFLGLLDRIETVMIGLYAAAVAELLQLHQLDSGVLAAGMGGVQSEHRMLGRAIAGLLPANNRALEEQPFGSVEAARGALQPFVTGVGWPGATRAVAVPTAAAAARVVGKYRTRRIQTFL